MSIFIVSCNIISDDFITAAREEIKRIFSSKGFEILETDLDSYAFFPFITAEEYRVDNKESLTEAQLLAYPDKYALDVLAEMEKIRKANILAFVIKPENLLMPTQFLGWIQRCLPIRFAVFSEERLFAEKQFILITGEKEGNRSQFNHLQKSINHIFKILELNVMTSRILTSLEDQEDFLNYLKIATFN
jgi:putative NADPH-quinone reductase